MKARIYGVGGGEGEGYCFVPLSTECPRVEEYARLSLNPEESKNILRFYDGNASVMVDDENFEE